MISSSRVLVLLLCIVNLCVSDSISSFPALFFSEQVVPGLRSKFHQDDNIYTKKELLNQVKFSIKECTSDAYFIINQPGLQLKDFENFQDFGYLRAYMKRASSIQAMPNVLTNDGDTLDLDSLNDFIELNCQAQTHRVVTDQADEVPHYIDIKKRVIRINFSELPTQEPERSEVLQKHDNVFKDIVRRLPSPHYFVLLTTDTLKDFNYSSSKKVNIYEEYPENLLSLDQLTPNQKLKLFENSIFPDITLFDKTREMEVERNSNVKQAEPRASFPKPRLTNDNLPKKDFGRFWNDINEFPNLLDRDLIVENELVILTILALLVLFITYKFVRLVLFGLKVIFTTKRKTE